MSNTNHEGPRVAYHPREKVFVVRGDDGRVARLDHDGAKEVLAGLAEMIKEVCGEIPSNRFEILDTVCGK